MIARSNNGAGIVEARNALSAAQIDAERIDRELQGARATAVAQFEAAGIEVTALTNRGLPAAESAAQLAGQGYEALGLFARETGDLRQAPAPLETAAPTLRDHAPQREEPPLQPLGGRAGS